MSSLAWSAVVTVEEGMESEGVNPTDQSGHRTDAPEVSSGCHPRVEDYLDRALASLIGRTTYAEREDLRTIIRRELAALVEARRWIGEDPVTAIDQALRQAGPPERHSALRTVRVSRLLRWPRLRLAWPTRSPKLLSGKGVNASGSVPPTDPSLSPISRRPSSGLESAVDATLDRMVPIVMDSIELEHRETVRDAVRGHPSQEATAVSEVGRPTADIQHKKGRLFAATLTKTVRSGLESEALSTAVAAIACLLAVGLISRIGGERFVTLGQMGYQGVYSWVKGCLSTELYLTWMPLALGIWIGAAGDRRPAAVKGLMYVIVILACELGVAVVDPVGFMKIPMISLTTPVLWFGLLGLPLGAALGTVAGRAVRTVTQRLARRLPVRIATS